MGLPGPVGSALKFGLMDDGVADATVSFSKRGIASGHLIAAEVSPASRIGTGTGTRTG